jgi:RHS repeat-associated protein
LAVYDKDDNLLQRFEYADGRMPVAMTNGSGNRYYLHYDQVGSLRAISRVLSPDNTTEMIKEITYDSYGNIISDSNLSFKVPFGFAGGLYDRDTKLVHFGYREYDPFTGKWTAKDPLLFGGGDSNLYGYVLGDPVDLVDPWGLFDCVISWPFKYPYGCTPKKDQPKNATEFICKKIEETCEDYAQRAFDYCNETYPSPTKSSVCAVILKEAYDVCSTKSKKITICEENTCDSNKTK